MSDKICLNCEFYNPKLRECRYNPPVKSTTGFTTFPDVYHDDWCGKFQERTTIR